TPGGPGDAFYWLLNLVPILVAFALLNSAALVKVLLDYRRTRNVNPLLLWVIVLSVWFNVLAFDHIKSLRFVDSKYSNFFQGVVYGGPGTGHPCLETILVASPPGF